MEPLIKIKPSNPQPGQHPGGGGSLFGHQAAKAAPTKDYSEDINSLSRRVRVLEERNSSVQNRMGIIEQNMLSRYKQLNSEIKTMLSEMSELKKDIGEMKDRILMFIKELQMCAKKEEINTLKKYIELWEPVNFVTHNEVKDIIKEELGKNHTQRE